MRAWLLLKPGGSLVYSTCSLSLSQNEAVIAWFMQEKHNEAMLEKIFVPSDTKTLGPKMEPPVPIEGWERLIRLEPWCSGCSGLFIGKIYKKKARFILS